MWSPDVYQGAPTPFTAFFRSLNAAGVAILLRFFFTISEPARDGSWLYLEGVEWPQVLLVVSMITMTLGNLSALSQQNVKRMLAYSGIAHAGYILMGLVALNIDGLQAMLFYIVVYLIMNLGRFPRRRAGGERHRQGGDRRLSRACMARLGGARGRDGNLHVLADRPAPARRIYRQFFLFAAVIKQQLYFLALVAVANSVISLYYYARVVKVMFLDFPEPSDGRVELNPSAATLLCLLSAMTLIFGLYWGPLVAFTSQSVKFFTKYHPSRSHIFWSFVGQTWTFYPSAHLRYQNNYAITDA
jgi:NADH-quinone oxidoreductase subunit N